MRDHPIIFSGPMVRALLDGRKTMTRRLTVEGMQRIKKNPRPSWWTHCHPGDQLWVRESFRISDGGVIYDAAGGQEDYIKPEYKYRVDGGNGPWRPSIHMPRDASRLTLEVTEVRTEPLHSIMWNGDAEREGIYYIDRGPEHDPWTWTSNTWCYSTPGDAFAALWKFLNGAAAWDTNPDVVAITFTVHRKNIDTFKQGLARK